jgi:signal peptidase I
MFLCIFAYFIYLPVDAYLLAKRNQDVPLKSYQRWWMYVLLFFGFTLASNFADTAIRAFVVEGFVVPTRGMSPTIQAGDRILVDKLSYNWNPIQRNDVVVFRSAGPGSPLFVMRVIGLPGDEIEIKDERVSINKKLWDDPHAVLDNSLYPWPELANYGPQQVPTDCFFVLGDNRRQSKDSRLIGPIPYSDLHGRARMIYWSRERIFSHPYDTEHFVSGPFRWERVGLRVD